MSTNYDTIAWLSKRPVTEVCPVILDALVERLYREVDRLVWDRVLDVQGPELCGPSLIDTIIRINRVK